MNLTSLYHAFYAAAFQILIALLMGDWLAGACFGAALFIGREHAQAEYRWIEKYGKGLRANMPWWGGFDYRVWDEHSFLWNMALPVLVVSGVAVFFWAL